MGYAEQRRHYRESHRTVGCKITHMCGVPLIVASLVTVFFSPRVALGLFAVGWALAFSGHLLFEKNQPVVFENPGNPLTYLYGLLFAAGEWKKVLRRRPLAEDPEER